MQRGNGGFQEGKVSSLRDWDQLVSMWRTAADKKSKEVAPVELISLSCPQC